MGFSKVKIGNRRWASVHRIRSEDICLIEDDEEEEDEEEEEKEDEKGIKDTSLIEESPQSIKRGGILPTLNVTPMSL